MSRSIACAGELGGVPLDYRFNHVHAFLLELSAFMTDLRLAANEERGHSLKNPGHLQYLQGRVHGVIFAFTTLLIYRGGFDEVDAIATAALNESTWLAHDYHYPEVAW